MGRRNNFLIISLLVMLAVLLGAILFSGDPAGDNPDSTLAATKTDEGSSESNRLGSKSAAVAGKGASHDGASRSRVEMPEGAAPQSRLIVISGRLVHEGKPAANTAMSFRPLSRRFGGMEVMSSSGAADKGTPLQTDGEGRFSMTVSVAQKGSLRLASESGRLFAEAGEGNKERAWLMLNGYEEDTDLGDLELVAAASLAGQVVNQAGQPVAGVRVSLGGESLTLALGGGGKSKTTDDDGRFEFVGLEARDYSIRTAAPNYVPAEQAISLKHGEIRTSFVVEVRKGGSISGTVINDLGQPVAGARVAPFRSSVRGGMTMTSVNDTEAVTTDEHGHFLIEGLDQNLVNLRATAVGHAQTQQNSIEIGTANVVFNLERRGTITGRLTDSTGAPIAGSQVRADPVRNGPAQMIVMNGNGQKTDKDGFYTLDNVSPGNVRIVAEGEGHRPVKSNTVAVRAGDSLKDINLVADLGATIEVHVVDHEGNDVEGAKVVVGKVEEPARSGTRRMMSFRTEDVEADGPGPGPGGMAIRMPGGAEVFGRGETGADGRVRIEGLPDGPVKLDATHSKMAEARSATVTLSKRQPVEAIMTLRPAGFVDVTSLMSDGSALGNARYKLVGPIVLGEESKSRSGTTDALGKTTIGPLVAGNYEFILKLDRNGMTIGEGTFVQISGAAENLLEDSRTPLVIESGETTSIKVRKPVLTEVSGTVSDSSGPVAKAQIRLEKVGSETGAADMFEGGMSARTDSEGKFAIADVAPGNYKLTYKRPTATIAHEQKVFLAKGQAKFERHLTLSGGSIRVEVNSMKDKMPLSRVEVTLRRPGAEGAPRRQVTMMITMSMDNNGGNSSTTLQSNKQRIVTDDDGVAVIEDVPPGEYTLVLKHSRHVTETIEKIVVADRTQTEAGTVDMRTAGVLRGTVTGFSAGAMVNIARVEYRKLGAKDSPESETAVNGALKIDSLEAGKWQVRATEVGPEREDLWGDWIDVEIKAGRSARVDIPLPKR